VCVRVGSTRRTSSAQAGDSDPASHFASDKESEKGNKAVQFCSWLQASRALVSSKMMEVHYTTSIHSIISIVIGVPIHSMSNLVFGVPLHLY
jgi:ABC-type lipoprotein release transport system permease subunit